MRDQAPSTRRSKERRLLLNFREPAEASTLRRSDLRLTTPRAGRGTGPLTWSSPCGATMEGNPLASIARLVRTIHCH